MYAILDIETTGGKYNEEGITEIAIYRHDGHEIVDQFISLVNPERPIQSFVVGLTGINNDMLRNAPKFYEVAKRIIEITEDCVIVAHNAKFDYRILRTEYNRLGYEYQRKSLCTIELSKKLLPDVKSYSLGKLTRELGIPLTNRHRASGDALATVKLFELLMNKDVHKEILTKSVKSNPKNQLDTKLIRIIDELPSITGVYYIHDENGEIIYIGKSKNIKKRINQHFTSTAHKSKRIQLEVETVTYEASGNELLALLKENEEIKQNKPKYNRALKKNIFTHALYVEEDKNGYKNLRIGKANEPKNAITTFTNLSQAKSIVTLLVEKYRLCQKLSGLYKTSSSCFHYDIKECDGACIGEESPHAYNVKVDYLIEDISFQDKTIGILGRGRKPDEKSIILIEDGIFKGIGYYTLNHQIQSLKMVKHLISPMSHNRDTQHIIQNHLRKYKSTKTISF